MPDWFEEGNLQFDFAACGVAERFDTDEKNAHGMKAVDFIAETESTLYFIEVKDFQHPSAPQEQKSKDFQMLLSAIDRDDKSTFILEMGTKIKDSLLRRYAEGHPFTKKVTYLLLVNLDKLGTRERGMLKGKIAGHIPTGLKKTGSMLLKKYHLIW